MHKLIALFFLMLCQCANAISWSLADNPVNIDFKPNQPVVITNTKNQSLQYMCEMRVNTSSDNTLLIKQLKGNGVVNGTTLESGRTLYLTIRQLQTMTVIAEKGASIQFTNLGTLLMRGVCYQ